MFEFRLGSSSALLGTSLIWGDFFLSWFLCLLGFWMSRSLSVLSPLIKACNTTLFYYRPPVNFPSVQGIFNNGEINANAMHPICRSVCQVCALYLCRIGEVLSLTLFDVISADRVICRGSKRGSAFIIYLPGLSQQVLESKVKDVSVSLFPVSYSQCYRSFLRAGIRFPREGRKNSMRCHAGRYAVRSLYSEGTEIGVLSDLLHHKSKSSILYYLN